jgi:hypothetical protein
VWRKAALIAGGVVVAGIAILQLIQVPVEATRMAAVIIPGLASACFIAAMCAYFVYCGRLGVLNDTYFTHLGAALTSAPTNQQEVCFEIGVLIRVLHELDVTTDTKRVEPAVHRLAALLDLVDDCGCSGLEKSQREMLYEVLFPKPVRQEYGPTARERDVLYRTFLVSALIRALGSLGRADTIPVLQKYIAIVPEGPYRSAALHSLETLQARFTGAAKGKS